MKVISVEKATSSNTSLRKWSDANSLMDEVVYFVGEQTGGRGQRGNSWESEPGKNLTISLLTKPTFLLAEEQFLISQIASLAIADYLKQHIEGVSVKWPNDIYYKDQKICGILIENDILDGKIARSIIGIGLNLNQKEFVSDAPNPVSLTQITGEEYNLEEVVYAIANGIFMYLNFVKVSDKTKDVYRKKYAEMLYRKEGFHLFENEKGQFSARIHHVEPSGVLVLEREDSHSLEEYAFKEVQF